MGLLCYCSLGCTSRGTRPKQEKHIDHGYVFGGYQFLIALTFSRPRDIWFLHMMKSRNSIDVWPKSHLESLEKRVNLISMLQILVEHVRYVLFTLNNKQEYHQNSQK